MHESPDDIRALQELLDRPYARAGAHLLEVHVPRYGEEWEQFLDSGPVYARIEADRMFTFVTPAS